MVKTRPWIKPAITLFFLAILTWLAPVAPLDPWHLLSPQKIAKMILALTTIQALASVISDHLGLRNGAIVTGFLGGLISSTATTAALARRSKHDRQSNGSSEILTFLSATGAMLVEGIALIMTGTSDVHFSNLIIFLGPTLATLGMIFLQYRKIGNRNNSLKTSTFKILPILKLSIFIVVILAVSKVSQNMFGQKGIFVLTSLVSLFEIHGSVIANIALQESGAINPNFLTSLLAVSIVASYLSKLFLISTLGSSVLKFYALKSTLFLFGSLAVSWLFAVSMV